jgi:maltose O-acetyltransferase
MNKMIKRAVRKIIFLYHRYFGDQNVCARLKIQPLIDRGLIVGKNVNIFDTYIDPLYPFLIKVGDNVTITSSALIAHDASMKNILGKSLIGRINIGNNVFVGYNSIILPDTTIGNNVVVGAGSVISKNIPDNSVVVGNSRIISSHDDYIVKLKKNMKTRPVYNFNAGRIGKTERDKMIDQLSDGVGFND